MNGKERPLCCSGKIPVLTTTHPQGATQGRSQMVMPKPEKIDIDFADARLTGMAGSLFVARLANQLKLPILAAQYFHGSSVGQWSPEPWNQ